MKDRLGTSFKRLAQDLEAFIFALALVALVVSFFVYGDWQAVLHYGYLR